MKLAAKFSMLAVAASLAAAGCTTPPPATGGGGTFDQKAPELHSVEVTPQEVGPNQLLKISATVSDNVGVTGTAFVVRHNGQPVNFCSGNAVLATGTAQSGTWAIQCTTPAVVNAGEYQVNTAVVDAKFNSKVTTDGPSNATSGHFTVTGGVSDTSGPTVTSVTSAPNVVARGGNLTITAAVADESGVSNVGFVVRRAGSAPGWCAANATLISGTAQDGIWQLTCPVPANAGVGNYIVNTATADVLNNLFALVDSAGAGLNGAFSVN
ncbi:MAG TPA: hypothetical protein VL068_08270 [Microthrixaceae bacterium]|nr:hypothetical protein [Microthrixaceae bacterium]